MAKDWRAAAKERVKEKQLGSRFKLEPGDNCFRILPNSKGEKFRPYEEIYQHTEVGPRKQLVRCGKNVDSKEGECWLCDEIIPKLTKSASKEARIRAQKLEPKEQMVVQVASIDADSQKWRGPLTWYVNGKKLTIDLLNKFSHPTRRYEDPIKGRNFNVTRTGTGRTDTVYGALEPDDVRSKVPTRILNELKPFSKVLPPYDEEVQRAAYYGRDVDRSRVSVPDADDDEGESRRMAIKKKAKKTVAKAGKKKAKKQVEEEEQQQQQQQEQEEQQQQEQQQEEEQQQQEQQQQEQQEQEQQQQEQQQEEEEQQQQQQEQQEQEQEQEQEEQQQQQEEEQEQQEEAPKKKKAKKAVKKATKKAVKKAVKKKSKK